MRTLVSEDFLRSVLFRSRFNFIGIIIYFIFVTPAYSVVFVPNSAKFSAAQENAIPVIFIGTGAGCGVGYLLGNVAGFGVAGILIVATDGATIPSDVAVWKGISSLGTGLGCIAGALVSTSVSNYQGASTLNHKNLKEQQTDPPNSKTEHGIVTDGNKAP